MLHTRSALALFFALLLLAPLPLAGAAEKAANGMIPVILDTDIGDDIDDTWALALLLRSPELDLKLVVTDFGDTVYRAKLVARLLEIAGRTDVPIGIGKRTAEKGGAQEQWVKDYDLARYPGKVHQDGVQALIDTAMASPVPMTLIAIGPPPNLKLALEREPRLASKLRFAGMYGSVHRGYNDKPQPEPEWNVKAAPEAARAVLSAPWLDAISTPLDTCGKVLLDGERYGRIAASRDPLAKAILENYAYWCPRHDWCAADKEHVTKKSSTLFDTVAVYLAFSRDLVGTETLGVRVGDDGSTTPDPSGRPLSWATSWKDLEAFEELVTRRLTSGAAAAR